MGGLQVIRTTGNRDLDEELRRMRADIDGNKTAVAAATAVTVITGPPGPAGPPGPSGSGGGLT
jgi:hypothetical protein